MNASVPCLLMRAGTSRGPFFRKEWLPEDAAARDRMLIAAVGGADPLALDGVGGGNSLNSKVAVVSRSTRDGCDLDYLFVQVNVGQGTVDTRPNCGNMLAGVVPFALETGLLAADGDETRARVFNINSGTRIDVTVRTPGGKITYEGPAAIDGVAGTAAPVMLEFIDAWGAATGSLFPSGKRTENVLDVPVTCIDAGNPLVLMSAAALGVRGDEAADALDQTPGLLQRIEKIRRVAGRRMGMGDVTHIVVPKPVIVSPGPEPGAITSRYFTPHRCHSSHAVTGAIGVATAFASEGTVASGPPLEAGEHVLRVRHPKGRIEVAVQVAMDGHGTRTIRRASLLRTARKIFEGQLTLPGYAMRT